MARDAGDIWNGALAQDVFAPSATLRRIPVGERQLMFCERRQQIFEFNTTLAEIWDGLARGLSPAQAASRLEAAGLDLATAQSYVGGALHEWLRQGDLTPKAAVQALSREPDQARTLRIDAALGVDLRLYGRLDIAAVDAAFAQFSAPGPVDLNISAVAHGDMVHLFQNDLSIGAVPPVEFVPRLKALFTERYLAASPGGFLAHGGLLARGDGAILLCGEPGAGKTTLCIALAGSDWTLCADDIVRFDKDGMAHGVPFAPAVKTGSWPLAARWAPSLAAEPAHLRTDDQWTRYLPMKGQNAPVRLRGVLLLQRSEGAAARLEPIDPVEALTTILDSAYASSHRIDGDALSALALRVSNAVCARLHYSDLEAAVELVGKRLG